MEEKDFQDKVKQLKKLHRLVSVTLIIAAIAFIVAPISTYYAKEAMPYGFKSLLMLIVVGDVPLLYWLYNKNVIEKQQEQTERQENFLKWSYIRMAIWTINVLLCLLVFHFDSDALVKKIGSSFYLTIFSLCILVFLARINEKDIEQDHKGGQQ